MVLKECSKCVFPRKVLCNYACQFAVIMISFLCLIRPAGQGWCFASRITSSQQCVADQNPSIMKELCPFGYLILSQPWTKAPFLSRLGSPSFCKDEEKESQMGGEDCGAANQPSVQTENTNKSEKLMWAGLRANEESWNTMYRARGSKGNSLTQQPGKWVCCVAR